MSAPKAHTPGEAWTKLTLTESGLVRMADGHTFDPGGESAQAIRSRGERFVSTWNACEGIDPAAVPGLVAALEAVLEYGDNGSAVHPGALVLDQARAALRRARGQ